MNRQQSLFDDDAPPWKEEVAGEQLVASVVFATGPQQTFDYQVPEPLARMAEVGKRLRVPLGRGNRPVVGYCVELAVRPAQGRPLKPILSVADRRCLLSPAMLRLTRWIAETYLCSWGQVLEAVVPMGVRQQAGTRQMLFVSVPPAVLESLPTLALTPKQRRVLELLAGCPAPITADQLVVEAKTSPALVRQLRQRGLIETEKRRVWRQEAAAPQTTLAGDLALHPDQRQALDAIVAALRARRHETLLLHGVTGSGKTEVYIRAIQEVVSYGRQAIVLVPEISLTPQTVARFRRRFARVAVLHSHLTDVERHAHWDEIAAGQVQVVVGARSAIFAPTPQLGLIVLDEEHESSFKQESAPRYHARDVALYRATVEAVPLVLGSATPSLETWHRAQQGEFRCLSMPRRVEDRPLPAVSTIDLRLEQQDRRYRGALSRPLVLAMQQALAESGQIILLLNRRGYSTHIQCPACGEVVRCPSCEIALTHHKQNDLAICHYCDHERPAPLACPVCRFEGIRYSGLGTQRLEAEVRARFPNARALRMDTDSMQTRGSHERALEEFRQGRAQILLGTQMIAKGLDFPDVTLVGVVNADTALHLPDFRAAERTFQLLAQVAGRTGRGDKGGRVLIQTHSPDHPAIRAAMGHDYQLFAGGELPHRELLAYPPFGRLIRLVIRGEQPAGTLAFASQLAQRLRQAAEAQNPAPRVLGPAPAPIAKLRDQYRFQVQLQGRDGDVLRDLVGRLQGEFANSDAVQWIADVDPLAML